MILSITCDASFIKIKYLENIHSFVSVRPPAVTASQSKTQTLAELSPDNYWLRNPDSSDCMTSPPTPSALTDSERPRFGGSRAKLHWTEIHDTSVLDRDVEFTNRSIPIPNKKFNSEIALQHRRNVDIAKSGGASNVGYLSFAEFRNLPKDKEKTASIKSPNYNSSDSSPTVPAIWNSKTWTPDFIQGSVPSSLRDPRIKHTDPYEQHYKKLSGTVDNEPVYSTAESTAALPTATLGNFLAEVKAAKVKETKDTSKKDVPSTPPTDWNKMTSIVGQTLNSGNIPGFSPIVESPELQKRMELKEKWRKKKEDAQAKAKQSESDLDVFSAPSPEQESSSSSEASRSGTPTTLDDIPDAPEFSSPPPTKRASKFSNIRYDVTNLFPQFSACRSVGVCIPLL